MAGQETEFVKTVIEYIQMRGGVAIRINSGMQVVGEKKSKRVFRGAPAGTADVIVCWRGRFVAIECKVGKNQATPLQEAFLESVRESGGLAGVVWTIEDVDEILGITGYHIGFDLGQGESETVWHRLDGKIHAK